MLISLIHWQVIFFQNKVTSIFSGETLTMNHPAFVGVLNWNFDNGAVMLGVLLFGFSIVSEEERVRRFEK